MKPDIIKDPTTRFPVTGNNAVERVGEKGSILRKETEIVDFCDYLNHRIQITAAILTSP